MKKILLMITSASLLTVTAIFEVVQTQSAQAQTGGTAQTNSADLMKEIEALKRLLPDQAHGMADVDYHFANLWFAAHNENWPLAIFKDYYEALGIYRTDIIIPFGIASMVIQGVVWALIYSRLFGGERVIRAGPG